MAAIYSDERCANLRPLDISDYHGNKEGILEQIPNGGYVEQIVTKKGDTVEQIKGAFIKLLDRNMKAKAGSPGPFCAVGKGLRLKGLPRYLKKDHYEMSLGSIQRGLHT